MRTIADERTRSGPVIVGSITICQSQFNLSVIKSCSPSEIIVHAALLRVYTEYHLFRHSAENELNENVRCDYLQYNFFTNNTSPRGAIFLTTKQTNARVVPIATLTHTSIERRFAVALSSVCGSQVNDVFSEFLP